MGFNVHNESDTDLNRVRSLDQAGWVRVDLEYEVFWDENEAEFDWTDLHRIVDECAGDEVADPPVRALRMVFVLYSGTGSGGLFGTTGHPTTDDTNGEWTNWVDFVTQAVAEFKGIGVVWEIWNEPNTSASWGAAPNAEDYALFAIRTAQEIRSVSGAEEEWVAAGAVAHGPSFPSSFAAHSYDDAPLDAEFIEEMLAYETPGPGAQTKLLLQVDLITFHTYSPPESCRAQSLALLDLLAGAGVEDDEFPIACTEFGMAVPHFQELDGYDDEVDAGFWFDSWTPESLGSDLVQSPDVQFGTGWSDYWDCGDIFDGQAEPPGIGNNAYKITAIDPGGGGGNISGRKAVFDSGDIPSGGEAVLVKVWLKSVDPQWLFIQGCDNQSHAVRVGTDWEEFSISCLARGEGTAHNQTIAVYESNSEGDGNIDWYIYSPRCYVSSKTAAEVKAYVKGEAGAYIAEQGWNLCPHGAHFLIAPPATYRPSPRFAIVYEHLVADAETYGNLDASYGFMYPTSGDTEAVAAWNDYY